MPIMPNLLERTYMLRLNRGVPPMLDLFGGMSLEAAITAADLGVFAALADDPATPSELGDRLDADSEGLAVLLAYLERAGYLTVQDEQYALSEITETWVLASSDRSYQRYFRFWREVLYPFWREHAADAIREGGPPRSVYDWLDDHPERWPVAQDAFALTAERIADEIAEQLAIPTNGSVLDVGGGHGLYSIAICDHEPSVTATVFDDPAVREMAASNIDAAELDDRIAFQAGDYEQDDLAGDYDAALAFNIVHGNDPGTNRQLFQQLAEAVRSGGQLAILDQFGDESRVSIANTGTRFLDLTYFVALGGRTYHTDTVEDWLADAGFALTDRHEFPEGNTTLLVAEKG